MLYFFKGLANGFRIGDCLLTIELDPFQLIISRSEKLILATHLEFQAAYVVTQTDTSLIFQLAARTLSLTVKNNCLDLCVSGSSTPA